MPSTNSQNGQVVTILKRSLGALVALIGGLLIVAIGIFFFGMATIPGRAEIDSSQNVFYLLFVWPLIPALLITFYAFCAAAPIWLLFYLPCHLLIPRTSTLWRPRVCIPLGAVAGVAGFWVELTVLTFGGNLNSGPWILNEAILAAFVGGCTCLVGSVIVKRSKEKEKRTLVVASEQR